MKPSIFTVNISLFFQWACTNHCRIALFRKDTPNTARIWTNGSQSIMLLPTFPNNLLQTEPKRSPEAITVQLYTVTTHFHWKNQQQKTLPTKPTSIDCHYEGILNSFSVLFMRTNVTDPIIVSTEAHKENRRIMKHILKPVSLCSELHLLRFGLSQRWKCSWLSTNGHLAVQGLLHKNITQSHV